MVIHVVLEVLQSFSHVVLSGLPFWKAFLDCSVVCPCPLIEHVQYKNAVFSHLKEADWLWTSQKCEDVAAGVWLLLQHCRVSYLIRSVLLIWSDNLWHLEQHTQGKGQLIDWGLLAILWSKWHSQLFHLYMLRGVCSKLYGIVEKSGLVRTDPFTVLVHLSEWVTDYCPSVSVDVGFLHKCKNWMSSTSADTFQCANKCIWIVSPLVLVLNKYFKAQLSVH